MIIIKTFENFNSNFKSKDSKELYLILKDISNHTYLVDRPSGHMGETISISFGGDFTYNVVKDIIDENNWYVEKFYLDSKGDTRRIDIRPVYSNFIIRKIPKKIYHASPSKNDFSIKNNGLIAKNSRKKLNLKYPPRIYFSKVKGQAFKKLIKELNWYENEKEWSIWEVDTSKLNIDYLYVDDAVSQNLSNPSFYYLQNVNVPSKYIKKVGTLNITR